MGKKLNVLELCLTLDTGGLEKIVVSLSNALAGRENVSPNICTVGRTSGEVLPASIQEGVGWFELKVPPYFDFKTAWRLLGLVRKRKINLIHAHGTQPLEKSSLCDQRKLAISSITRTNSASGDENLITQFKRRSKLHPNKLCRRDAKIKTLLESSLSIMSNKAFKS